MGRRRVMVDETASCQGHAMIFGSAVRTTTNDFAIKKNHARVNHLLCIKTKRQPGFIRLATAYRPLILFRATGPSEHLAQRCVPKSKTQKHL